MKKILLIILLLISIPVVSAEMSVDISISNNDIITVDYQVSFYSDKSYDSFEFISVSEPLSINYDGEHTIKKDEEGYIITFFKDVEEGLNEAEFSILYDDLIQKSGNSKVLRTSIISIESDPIRVKAKLPEGYFLSGNPSTSPEPKNINSNGQNIELEWNFLGNGSIIVFYETNDDNVVAYAFILLIALCIFFIYVFLNKRKTQKKIEEILSEDEKKILSEMKKGNEKQKDISKKLEFSKSKMSKVVRKLEEKNLIERTPHFKTNILKIKK